MIRPHLKVNLLHIVFIFFLILFPAFKILAFPIVEITAPTNGTVYIAGDTVTILSNVTNSGGPAIHAVEFYINDVYIGKDSSAPYQFNWIGVEGTHLLTTREDHAYCYKTPSVPVQIVVKKNTAPAVFLTEPVNGNNYFNPLPIEISATAIDTDGTISYVDFFVNSIFIGRDQVTPFKISWNSIPGIYTITAKAVDNKNTSTTSSPVTITVQPPVNSPPAITITSPANGTYFTLGNPIVISANATDADGSVSSVEFFANTVSLGTDYTAPYEISWAGTSGIITLTAKATDDDCATSISDAVHISVVDPNAPPYIIQSISGQCSDPSFCLPVKAIFPVKDIIGYDLVLHYDKTKVHPTGKLNFNNDLINAGHISYIVNDIDSLGLLNISVFLNSTAPPTTTFHGLGQLFCAEFSKTSLFAPHDTAFFSISDLQESYANGVAIKQATPGYYANLKNTIYKGALRFWSDASPIKYDVLSPTQYLISNIYGTNSNCANKSVSAVQPDLNGRFSYSLINGTSMQVERDILPGTNVQPVINGMDVILGYAVVLSDPAFVPNIYQMIALDVNMDGFISAGDLSQINQRSIKTILEFKQKWNYTNNGNSNGQLSKDWIFIDSTLLADPAYKISITYPSDDGKGFSKYKVPVPPFCVPVPAAVCNSCISYKEGNIKGVLLGDVNGNYDAIPADGQIKRNESKGIIYLDFAKTKTNKNYTDIPVYFSSPEKIVALDFSLKLDETIEKVVIIQPAPYLNDAFVNTDEDHVLRFTSNGRKEYETNKPVAFLRFTNPVDIINNEDLTELKGYLNGEPVPFEITNNIGTGTFRNVQNKDIQIYPNPVNGVLNVIVQENSTIQLVDIHGKEIIIEAEAKGNEKLEIHTEHLKSGVYFLKVSNDHFVNTEPLVIQGK